MVSMWKSLQSMFTEAFADMPEGLKVVTEFVWKIRWFLMMGFVLFGVYQLVMVVLPYLMWTFIIKMVVGSIFSFISL